MCGPSSVLEQHLLVGAGPFERLVIQVSPGYAPDLHSQPLLSGIFKQLVPHLCRCAGWNVMDRVVLLVHLSNDMTPKQYM